MTTEERQREDEAQLEYLSQWRLKKEQRKFCKDTMIQHLKWAWFSFKRYLKGGEGE